VNFCDLRPNVSAGVFALSAEPGGGSIMFMEISATVSIILSQKNPQIWSINPSATVFEAIALMAEKNVGALPVVAADSLVGVVSERDYTRKVILKGKSSKKITVQEIMTHELVTACPGDNVVDCMRLMTERRVRHLPVMEGDRMVGILSVGDLVKWIISAQTATIDQLTKYVFGEYSM
jgi:signal-transduction protein with cAMP-binding, CBS, and nucleotidyltransferase domain